MLRLERVLSTVSAPALERRRAVSIAGTLSASALAVVAPVPAREAVRVGFADFRDRFEGSCGDDVC